MDVVRCTLSSLAIRNLGSSSIDFRTPRVSVLSSSRLQCSKAAGGGRQPRWRWRWLDAGVKPGRARAAATESTFGEMDGIGRGSMPIDGRRFPFLSRAGQNVMTNVCSILEQELGPFLKSSTTPSDVRYFKNEQGNAEGSVFLRAGNDSKVDFTLESWLHATLPFGTLDIATLVVMLGPETDSPHFLFEFIQSGPSLVVVLDHLPRKDLVMEAEYQKRFYEDPDLDKIRQLFETAPESKPYISSVLFIRSVVSPTAVLYKLSSSTQVDGGGLEEQIENVVYPGSEKMVKEWVESFRTRGLPVTNVDDMVKRDNQIKTLGIEVDLSVNLPRLFGQEISDRIVHAFRTSGCSKT
ncbi:red chlorophyll catabolite reductase [Marchantia polymorpha subsp. ruderalis]